VSKVPINESNLRHCRCPQCPVEIKSNCSVQKLSEMKDPPEMENLNSKNTPELYCGLGKSDCSDLDLSQACQCPTCLVWDENNLTSTYYCDKGSADKVD
jgi:hypothetical protein